MSEIFSQSDSLQKGLLTYFNRQVESGVMSFEEASKIMNKTLENIRSWLQDSLISNLTKEGIRQAIEQERWSDLVYAFWQEVTFGTGGIRGRAALSESELYLLASEGLSAKILKGPNTINDVVFSKITLGVARYMKKRGMKNVVIGYDSRIRGRDFAELIARIFISNGIKVHLFDEPTPYPELSYAVTFLRADIGIEISASHNDKRYNGYKICTVTGASLNLNQRQEVIDEIYGNENNKVTTSTMELVDLKDAPLDLLAYLGGDKPLLDIGNHSYTNLHKEYLGHIKEFVLRLTAVEENLSKVNIGYCAYYGSGHKLVPWLLREMGFSNLRIVSEMNTPNGLFPAFKLTELPDPGFIGSATMASEKFKEEHGDQAFEALDMFVGTDPDADRMGLTVNIPKSERAVSGDWRLLTANDLWTLVLWYRLSAIAEKNGGKIPNAGKKMIVKSHVTSEALRRVAKKFNVACEDTWVGFGFLAERIIEKWGEEYTNLGAFEESNGFTIGGAKPQKGEPLGQDGHTLEKDGTLATLLTAEIAAYAKSKQTTLMDLLNRLYLDPDIGCFVTLEITLPEVGVFEGVEGELLKRKIIHNVERMAQKISKGDTIYIADQEIVKTKIFATGKYDNIYWTGFPDEGIRFYFDNTDDDNHLTIRPSGTEAKLRFYIQYKLQKLTPENVWANKTSADKYAEKLIRAAIDMIQNRQF